MVKCENCIHCAVCGLVQYCPNGCHHYKSKSLFVELPVKVGDVVFRIWSVGKYGKSVADFVVTGISQIARNIWVIKYQKQAKSLNSKPVRYQCNLEDIGKTVFLDRAEAEKKLQEMENLK